MDIIIESLNRELVSAYSDVKLMHVGVTDRYDVGFLILVDGETIAGKKVIKACQRHLDDLERVYDDDFDYVYLPERAEIAVKFMELLPDISTGMPVKLAEFQSFITYSLYGWYRKSNNKLRRFNKALISMARKNGKSFLISGPGIFELLAGKYPIQNRQIYCTAQSREQASIVFNMVVQRLDGLLAKSEAIRGQVRKVRNEINHNPSYSVLKPLSKDTGNINGLAPTLSILDEYGASTSNEMMEVLESGSMLQPNMLTLIISTAYFDLNSPMYTQEYKHAEKILNNEVEQDNYFALIYEQDDEEEIYNEDMWIKSNPLLEVKEIKETLLRNLRGKLKEAVEKNDLLGTIVKNFNMWKQGSENSFLPIKEWQACEAEPINIYGRDVFLGLDLSRTGDLTALYGIYPLKENKFYIDGHSLLDFITMDNLIEDNHKKSIEDTLETYDFIAFGDKRYSEFLEKRNRVIIPDEDGTLREFVIFENARYLDTEGRKIQVFGHASYLELKKANVVYPDSFKGTATQHGGRALKDTGWQIGIVEVDGDITITINEHTVPYDYLKRIAKEFDGELSFRIEHDGRRITGRYVDILDRIGDWQGREVEFGKDLDSIRRVEKQDIVTALLGLGPERDDGPRIEVLIEDFDALQRWGRIDEHGELQHLIEPYEIQSERSEMTQTEAHRYTRTALNKRINTQITYETTILDLEEVVGHENKKIRFGDTIKIKDTKFNPPLYLEARVFEMTRSIKRKDKKDIKLGDFIEHTEEEVNAKWKELQKQIQKRVSHYEMAEYTYDKLTIDDKDETVFEEGKTFAEATGIKAEENAKEFAAEEDKKIKVNVQEYADNVSEQKAQSALDSAKQYAVAKEVYDIQMEQIASDIEDRAPIEYVDGELQHAINDLNFGGKNLLINSDFKKDFIYGSGTETEWGKHIQSDKISVDTENGIVKIGEGAEVSQMVFEEYGDYVLSVLAKGAYLTIRSSGNGIKLDNQRLTEDFRWYKIPFNFPTKASLSRLIIGASGGEVEIDKIQLEKGNKSTDWSPAPEDIFSEIEKKADGNTVYTIEDVDNMINNTVSITQYETDKEDIVTDLKSQGTRIGQNEKAIGLKADSSELDAVENSLNTKIGNVEVKANEVKTSVSEVKADLDGLEVGGRNLLLGTQFLDKSPWNVSHGKVTYNNTEQSFKIEQTNNAGNTTNRIEQNFEYESDTTYTIQVKVKPQKDGVPAIGFGSGHNDNAVAYSEKNKKVEIGRLFISGGFKKLENEWVLIWGTFKGRDSHGKDVRLWSNIDSSEIGSYAYFKEPQLERSSKPSDYGVAPEDTDEAINEVSGRVTSAEGVSR